MPIVSISRLRPSFNETATGMALIAGALLALELAIPAQADTIYTYTGNDYNQCAGTYCSGGPYALSVTFDTTLTGNSLDNLASFDITSTITSFTFSDGSGLIINKSNSSFDQAEISTNSSGNIVNWLVGACGSSCNIQMQTNWNSPFGFIPGADFSETTASFNGSFGFRSDDPETWVERTAVPEPSTWAMMVLGFAGLGFAGYRASRKAVSIAA
jgi:hypothetical protein